MKYKQWNRAASAPQARAAMEAAGVPPLAALTLCARGLDTPEKASAFLDAGRGQLLDPFLMKDMDRAAARVRRALAAGEHIAVYGDYDVDGITSTCLLTDFLRREGGTVIPYIPDRMEEGYGLNREAVAALRGQGVGIDAIMVTAANDAPTVDTLLKLGVVDYLVKPFTYERFQQALDNFCRHRDAVAGDAVEQSALDRLFSPALPAEHQPPKGLQESTLELVRACLRAAPPQGLPSEALSRQTGLSVVTVRRYVNYLVERGEAASAVNYDTGGRPCRLYRCPGPPA